MRSPETPLSAIDELPILDGVRIWERGKENAPLTFAAKWGKLRCKIPTCLQPTEVVDVGGADSPCLFLYPTSIRFLHNDFDGQFVVECACDYRNPTPNQTELIGEYTYYFYGNTSLIVSYPKKLHKELCTLPKMRRPFASQQEMRPYQISDNPYAPPAAAPVHRSVWDQLKTLFGKRNC